MKKYIVFKVIRISFLITFSNVGCQSLSEVVSSDYQEGEKEIDKKMINIKIKDRTLTATLVDNSSTEALAGMLKKDPLGIEMRDYGKMEKVGSFGINLPTNDEPIVTEAGDLILY